MMTPCQHVLCLGCQKNRIENKDKCPECNQKVEKMLSPINLIDKVISKYKDKKKLIREIIKNEMIKSSL